MLYNNSAGGFTQLLLVFRLFGAYISVRNSRMVTSPESMPEIPIDFRAPPPSPVASGRRSTVTNDDILTEFLQTSLRVPDLVLPDKIFPKQKHIESPSKLDFQILTSAGDDGVSDSEILLPAAVIDSIARIGCFQLVNHGISRAVTRFVLAAATGIFQLSPEKKKAVARRSQEKPYGFEEDHGDHEMGSDQVISEEFVWCRDAEGLKLEMEGIWPEGYPKFCNKMETFSSDIEKIADRILQAVSKSFPRKSTFCINDDGDDGQLGTVCCIYKHNPDNSTDGWSDSLKYEVITMLIKGADHSHSLCLHVCDGSSEFHVYSKKGWFSFVPDEHAFIITVGDQLQAASGGHYKHVIGRPIFKGEAEGCISMAFLYSPESRTREKEHSVKTKRQEKSISLYQQAMLAIILSLLYRCLLYIYNNI